MKNNKTNEQELYNKLVKHLYNIFDKEIRPDLWERGFIYFSYNNVIKTTCEELAETQEEYNYYFMNYHKALDHVKSFFIEDINKMNNTRELEATKQEEKQRKKREKKKEKSLLFLE